MELMVRKDMAQVEEPVGNGPVHLKQHVMALNTQRIYPKNIDS